MSNTKTRKLTVVRKPTEPLRLEQGEAVHVGVDVHKASSSVALSSDRRGLIATWVQPARPDPVGDHAPRDGAGHHRRLPRATPPVTWGRP